MKCFPKTVATLFSPAIKPPPRPLFWAALAFGAGIAVGEYAWRLVLWWVLAAPAFLGAAGFFARRRIWLAFPLALGSLFFVGALEIQLRNTQQLPSAEILAFADGSETIVTAHVTHEGEIREGSYGGSRPSIDVETEQIEAGGATHPTVLNNFRPRELWVGAMPQKTDSIEALLEYTKSLGVRVVRHSDSEILELGGMRAEVFSPPEAWVASAQAKNNDSLCCAFVTVIPRHCWKEMRNVQSSSVWWRPTRCMPTCSKSDITAATRAQRRNC